MFPGKVTLVAGSALYRFAGDGLPWHIRGKTGYYIRQAPDRMGRVGTYVVVPENCLVSAQQAEAQRQAYEAQRRAYDAQLRQQAEAQRQAAIEHQRAQQAEARAQAEETERLAKAKRAEEERQAKLVIAEQRREQAAQAKREAEQRATLEARELAAENQRQAEAARQAQAAEEKRAEAARIRALGVQAQSSVVVAPFSPDPSTGSAQLSLDEIRRLQEDPANRWQWDQEAKLPDGQGRFKLQTSDGVVRVFEAPLTKTLGILGPMAFGQIDEAASVPPLGVATGASVVGDARASGYEVRAGLAPDTESTRLDEKTFGRVFYFNGATGTREASDLSIFARLLSDDEAGWKERSLDPAAEFPAQDLRSVGRGVAWFRRSRIVVRDGQEHEENLGEYLVNRSQMEAVLRKLGRWESGLQAAKVGRQRELEAAALASQPVFNFTPIEEGERGPANQPADAHTKLREAGVFELVPRQDSRGFKRAEADSDDLADKLVDGKTHWTRVTDDVMRPLYPLPSEEGMSWYRVGSGNDVRVFYLNSEIVNEFRKDIPVDDGRAPEPQTPAVSSPMRSAPPPIVPSSTPHGGSGPVQEQVVQSLLPPGANVLVREGAKLRHPRASVGLLSATEAFPARVLENSWQLASSLCRASANAGTPLVDPQSPSKAPCAPDETLIAFDEGPRCRCVGTASVDLTDESDAPGEDGGEACTGKTAEMSVYTAAGFPAVNARTLKGADTLKLGEDHRIVVVDQSPDLGQFYRVRIVQQKRGAEYFSPLPDSYLLPASAFASPAKFETVESCLGLEQVTLFEAAPAPPPVSARGGKKTPGKSSEPEPQLSRPKQATKPKMETSGGHGGSTSAVGAVGAASPAESLKKFQPGPKFDEFAPKLQRMRTIVYQGAKGKSSQSACWGKVKLAIGGSGVCADFYQYVSKAAHDREYAANRARIVKEKGRSKLTDFEEAQARVTTTNAALMAPNVLKACGFENIMTRHSGLDPCDAPPGAILVYDSITKNAKKDLWGHVEIRTGGDDPGFASDYFSTKPRTDSRQDRRCRTEGANRRLVGIWLPKGYIQ